MKVKHITIRAAHRQDIYGKIYQPYESLSVSNMEELSNLTK